MVSSIVLSLAVLVAAMAVAVGVTLVLENWRRWRPPVPEADPSLSTTAGRTAEVDEVDPAAAAPLVGELDLDDAAVEVELAFADRAAADRLVAVLFASVAAGRGPDADRAAAWVTASDWPPGAFGGEFRPGADLRGRPAAVRRLLERDDDGRCWVTLRGSVDIAKGLRMRPPRGDELTGIVPLWTATRSSDGQLDRGSCEAMAVALDRLEHLWAPTVAAVEVQALRRAITEVLSSAAPDASLEVQIAPPVRTAPGPAADRRQPAGSRPAAPAADEPATLAS